MNKATIDPGFEYQQAKLDEIARRIVELPKDGRRRLVAVAGAPASGKSVLAAALCDAVNSAGRAASAIPMDGFHLDNCLLDERDLRGRKGAPETFDAAGFVALMHRLKSGGEVVYPLFDRPRDLAIAGAAVIKADCDVAIVEGNYLLFDEDPWRKLAPLWDLSVWFDVPESVLLQRCVKRWIDHNHTLEAALSRAEGNDMANARRIMRARLPADVMISPAPHTA